mmetsp:Transcript_64881/g.154936  ORF Transcript_64881/g.154936 Transcript_64881/m.154936 type:complete len:1217 (+) Transcript_64881:162-3812(+)
MKANAVAAVEKAQLEEEVVVETEVARVFMSFEEEVALVRPIMASQQEESPDADVALSQESGLSCSGARLQAQVSAAVDRLKSLNETYRHSFARVFLRSFDHIASSVEGAVKLDTLCCRLVDVLVKTAADAEAFAVSRCASGHPLRKITSRGRSAKPSLSCSICCRLLGDDVARWCSCDTCKWATCASCAASGGSLSVLLLHRVAELFGGSQCKSVAAPRDRMVRTFMARVFVRTLPSALSSVEGEARERIAALASTVLHRFTRDKATAIRLAAAHGWSHLGTEDSYRALARLAAEDPRAAIRSSAIMRLQHDGNTSESSVMQFSGRSYDVSPAVRRRFYSILAGQTSPSGKDPTLLARGLEDSEQGVRSHLCKAALLKLWSKPDIQMKDLLEVLQELRVDQSPAAMQFAEELAGRVLQAKLELVDSPIPQPAPGAEAHVWLLWRIQCTKVNRDTCCARMGLKQVVEQVEESLDGIAEFALRQVLLALLAMTHTASSQRNAPADVEDDDIHIRTKRFALQVLSYRMSDSQGMDEECCLASKEWPSCVALAAALLSAATPQQAQQKRLTMSSHAAACYSTAVAAVLDHCRKTLGSALPLTSAPEDWSEHAGIILHVLRVLEATLPWHCHLAADDPLHAVVSEWLQPVCAMADQAEAEMGEHMPVVWLQARALAVRCVALHASVAGDDKVEAHWLFFLSVLQLPTASTGAGLAAAEAVVQTCLQFLADALLQGHQDDRLPEASNEFFETVASRILQHPPPVGGPWLASPGADASAAVPRLAEDKADIEKGMSPRLRRSVANCLCSLFLYTGGGVEFSKKDFTKAHQVAPGASWALAWLLMDAFCTQLSSPPCQAEANDRHDSMQEIATAAAHRGQLLRFFTCLGRSSTSHARLLAAAVETFLSTDLWKLGLPMNLWHGFCWSVLSLPRLLRLCSVELLQLHPRRGAHPPADLESISNGDALSLRLWYECLWLPLAVRCLELPAARAPDRKRRTLGKSFAGGPLQRAKAKEQAKHMSVLALSLQAAASVLAPIAAGTQQTQAGQADGDLHHRSTGVLWLLRRSLQDILKAWHPIAKDLDGLGGQKAFSIVESLCQSFGPDASDDHSVEEEYTAARRRRANLSQSIASLGVDAASMVVVATKEAKLSANMLQELMINRNQQGCESKEVKLEGKAKPGVKSRRVLQKRETMSDDDSDAKETEGMNLKFLMERPAKVAKTERS